MLMSLKAKRKPLWTNTSKKAAATEAAQARALNLLLNARDLRTGRDMVEATTGTEATMTGEATGVVAAAAVAPTRGLVEGGPIMAMEEVAVDTVEDAEEEGTMTEGTIVVEEEVLLY